MTQTRSNFVGIHYSGANTHKTSLVVLISEASTEPAILTDIYSKIGADLKVFSDDRILGILNHHLPVSEVMVDCPLSVPPCVACERPKCPGVISCEDLSVAYMLSLHDREQAKMKRSRPVNPQTQRLWDAFQNSRSTTRKRLNPSSYSPSNSSLATRAKVLQKRLNQSLEGLVLQETSVPLTLIRLKSQMGVSIEYKNFEKGALVRSKILDRFVELQWIQQTSSKMKTELVDSVENFQAFITGWVCYLKSLNKTLNRPEDYPETAGWVYLPDLE